MELNSGHVFIEVIAGCEGPSLSIGDGETGYRLSGPKPWGGGRTTHQFQVRIDELQRELDAIRALKTKGGEQS